MLLSENLYITAEFKPPRKKAKTSTRVFRAQADASLLHLHIAMQAAWGFDNYHFWQFLRREPFADFRPQTGEERLRYSEWTSEIARMPLTDFFLENAKGMMYGYDPMSGWEFELTALPDIIGVRRIHPTQLIPVECIEVSGWNLMEDIGGPYAMLDIIDALTNNTPLPDVVAHEHTPERLAYHLTPDVCEINGRIDAIAAYNGLSRESWDL